MEKYSFEIGIIALHFGEMYASLPLPSSEHRHRFNAICQMVPLPSDCTYAMENDGIAAI